MSHTMESGVSLGGNQRRWPQGRVCVLLLFCLPNRPALAFRTWGLALSVTFSETFSETCSSPAAPWLSTTVIRNGWAWGIHGVAPLTHTQAIARRCSGHMGSETQMLVSKRPGGLLWQ